MIPTSTLIFSLHPKVPLLFVLHILPASRSYAHCNLCPLLHPQISPQHLTPPITPALWCACRFAFSSPFHPLALVWDYQTKKCVATLEGHTHNVSAVTVAHDDACMSYRSRNFCIEHGISNSSQQNEFVPGGLPSRAATHSDWCRRWLRSTMEQFHIPPGEFQELQQVNSLHIAHSLGITLGVFST